MNTSSKYGFGSLIYFTIAFALAAYFTFAAVQGDFGLFRRAEIMVEADTLTKERDALRQKVARMENLTHRMSDDFIDLDLLDQQARDILGLVRADEVVVN